MSRRKRASGVEVAHHRARPAPVNVPSYLAFGQPLCCPYRVPLPGLYAGRVWETRERPASCGIHSAGFSLPPECCYHGGPQREAEPHTLARAGPTHRAGHFSTTPLCAARQGQFPCYNDAAARAVVTQNMRGREARAAVPARRGLLFAARMLLSCRSATRSSHWPCPTRPGTFVALIRLATMLNAWNITKRGMGLIF